MARRFAVEADHSCEDTFLECSGCGKVVTWADYRANNAVQDNWYDGGEDAYCPDCKEKEETMVDPNSTKGAFKRETMADIQAKYQPSTYQPSDPRLFLLKVAKREVGAEEYHVFSSLEDLTEWKAAHRDYAGVREDTAVYYLVTPEQLANPKQLSDLGI